MNTQPITGIRLNTYAPGDVLYQILLPTGQAYTDVEDNNTNAWPMHVAKIIARNISTKRKCMTTLVKVVVEEPVSTESSYDRIVNYVDTLKGASLTSDLVIHELPVGRDPVASKRVRLISHLTKCNHN